MRVAALLMLLVTAACITVEVPPCVCPTPEPTPTPKPLTMMVPEYGLDWQLPTPTPWPKTSYFDGCNWHHCDGNGCWTTTLACPGKLR